MTCAILHAWSRESLLAGKPTCTVCGYACNEDVMSSMAQMLEQANDLLEEDMEPHQLKMLSNQDLIAEYRQAQRMKNGQIVAVLAEELKRRGLWPLAK